MCRLLKLQYACSSNGKPHYMENVQGAYIPCNDRHGCFIEEALALKPGSDTTPPGSPIEREYTIVKIGGDCETCANKKTRKIEEEDKIGCGLQIMDQDTIVCKRHHDELELAISALR
ncbi:hypothetical protein FOC4_g10012552 [Fusarium odoratissimum]|uniref:Uncharacterized protein n=1 Tax=Fusarium oxysporum f. sp. cubense (strain race 4) TaxID=2502994 RepID=N1RQQ8_FUSC4|nr:hypothetical protein FOC4_g10012552 [Fusarium odoratissimum]